MKWYAPDDWVPQVGEVVICLDHFQIFPTKGIVKKITPTGAVRVGSTLYKKDGNMGYVHAHRNRMTTWSSIVPLSVFKKEKK